MRQHNIEMNWRVNPIRSPKVRIGSFENKCNCTQISIQNTSLTLVLQVLKGHDDHVITCLQFSGNRIVSGSDDNTLKVLNKFCKNLQICHDVVIIPGVVGNDG